MRDKRRDLAKYRKASTALRRRAKREGLPCWICRQPIDFDLHPSDKWAFTADHKVALAAGGDIMGPLRPAHRSCNSRRQTGAHERAFPSAREW